jgi:hypothetical protein
MPPYGRPHDRGRECRPEARSGKVLDVSGIFPGASSRRQMCSEDPGLRHVFDQSRQLPMPTCFEVAESKVKVKMGREETETPSVGPRQCFMKTTTSMTSVSMELQSKFTTMAQCRYSTDAPSTTLYVAKDRSGYHDASL